MTLGEKRGRGYVVIMRVWASVTLSLVMFVAACGGGGGSSSESTTPTIPSPYYVRVASPSSSGNYETGGSSVTVSGSSFVPRGAGCSAVGLGIFFYPGFLPFGYEVTWANSATGLSGSAWTSIGCLLTTVNWDAFYIPLAVGSNAITVSARDASGNWANDTIVVTRIGETTAPTVVSTSPSAAATGVPAEAAVMVFFSEAMDAATVTPSTVTLKDASNNVIAGLVSYDVLTMRATLSPSVPLSYVTTYTATVTTGVRDTSANAMAVPFIFSFTTGANPDTMPPAVQSVSPAGGSSCASISGAIAATFDEDIAPATVNGNTFNLVDPAGAAVSGVVTYLNRTAVFTPGTALAPLNSYVATLTPTITDLAGNALTSPYQWNFSTTVPQGVGTWAPTGLNGVPLARSGHVAVWTGSEMIVAGGRAWDSSVNQFAYTNQYGRYNPATGNWTVAAGAPVGMYQKAVWTGSHMLVWGGANMTGPGINAGAQLDPATNSWSDMVSVGQPSGRKDHTAVWTGSEMIVWGGLNGASLPIYGDGARYNPVTNTWQTMSMIGAPSARYGHIAVWTGSQMIIWGGVGATGAILGDGARYNPATDTWAPVASTDAPSERFAHIAVWTGSRMIVWGGSSDGPYVATGGSYDPVTDTWTAIDAMCAPVGLFEQRAVWSGTKMIVWGGGMNGTTSNTGDGYEYDPIANSWTRISVTGAPSTRFEYTAIWAGDKLIVWGGGIDGTVLNTGATLLP